MKKLVFIFFALFFATIITGCNSRENTVRFNTNIVDEENSDGTVNEESSTDTEDSAMPATDDKKDEASINTTKQEEAPAMNPADKAESLPYTGSSAWLAFIISLSISGSYVLIQKLKKSRA